MRKTYKSYKHSGVEWIGEIPNHWDATALKRLVAMPITDGPHETPTFIEVGVPFVSAEAVQDGTINFSACRGYISAEEDQRFSLKCKPQRGDVFLVKSGSTTGKVAYVNTDSNFNIWSPIALIRNGEMHVGRYLFYALSSNYFQTQVQLYWSFGTQPNIGMNVLENLLVIYPTKKEQEAISTYLDEKTALIDSTIRKKEKLIELLLEERTAIINQAVTRGLDPNVKMKDSGVEWLGEIPEHWEVKRLKHACSLQSGDTITAERIFPTGSYPVYGGNGLRGYTETYTHDGFYPLIGRQGALCGNINYGTGVFFASEHAVVVTTNADIESYWAGELLRVMNLGQYSISAAQPGLSVEILKQLKIPVPPLEEQKRISAFIKDYSSKFEATSLQLKRTIDYLQEYRTALINEVVTGKRCVI